MLPRFFWFAVLCAVSVAGLAVAAADMANDVAKEATDDPAPPGGPGGRELFLIFSNNNEGYIDVCGCKHRKIRQGSITRRASYLKQVRFKHNDVLLISGGNTFFGRDDRKAKPHEKKQLLEKAKLLLEAYNRFEYRALAMGHSDLGLGLDFLKQLEKQAKFPFLCANFVYQESGKNVFPPTAEIEVNGVKVGIMAVTLDTLQPYYLDMKAPGTRATDATQAVQKHLPRLRDRNDIVVLFSENDEGFNQKLMEENPGIDFLIDPSISLGNAKLRFKPEELRDRWGETYVLRTDSQGARLGTIDLTVFPGGERPFVDRDATETVPEGRSSFQYLRLSLEPHFLEDPEIAKMVELFKKSTKFVATEELPPLPHKDQYQTESTCQACHQEQHNWWQKSPHAKAFAALEKTGDQWRQDCIGCHTLGYGQAFLKPEDAEPYKNVQCESCHGLNPMHPTDPVAHRWPRIREMACLTCHNEDQTGIKFHFAAKRRQMSCPKMPRQKK
ncbi:MAG: multiheme c-type cytochrome [Planctomycetota bacterium]